MLEKKEHELLDYRPRPSHTLPMNSDGRSAEETMRAQDADTVPAPASTIAEQIAREPLAEMVRRVREES